MESKNEVIKNHIEKYFLMLKHQEREVNEDILCELIQQWAFDYRIEKN